MSVNIKATPVNGLHDFVTKELGADKVAEIVEKLPAENRKFFTGHLLAHDLVPLEATNTFTELAAEAKGEPLEEFAIRAGRFGADLGLKTVFKFVLMVMSTEGVLKKAPFMFTRVYDGGKMDVQPGDNVATITITEFPSHVAVCSRITGWFQVIGERSGAKNITLTHEPCAARGGGKCVWNFSWT